MGIIQITTDAQGTSVVSARELHEFLEVKERFVEWFNRRVAKWGLIEGQDYMALEGFSEKSEKLGRPEIDYALTLDSAKELSMVQNNAKGKEARQYFIECEKQLRQFVQPAVPQLSRKELALMIVQIEEENERLERQLAEAKPKVEYVDQVLDTNDCFVTTVIANELGYSAMKFNKLLHERGIQWKVGGVWVLTSKYADKGYHEMRTHTYLDSRNERHAAMSLVWTQRGRAMLHELFKQHPVTV